MGAVMAHYKTRIMAVIMAACIYFIYIPVNSYASTDSYFSPYRVECSKMVEEIARKHGANLSDSGQTAILKIYSRCLEIGADTYKKPYGYFRYTNHSVWVDNFRSNSKYVFNSEYVESYLDSMPMSFFNDMDSINARVPGRDLYKIMETAGGIAKDRLIKPEIAALLGKTLGLTAQEISEKTGIGYHMVGHHQNNAMAKLAKIVKDNQYEFNFGDALSNAIGIVFIVGVLVLAGAVVVSVGVLVANIFGTRDARQREYSKEYAKSVVEKVYVTTR